MTTKDQDLFLDACSKILGGRYGEYFQYACEVYETVWAQHGEISRENEATRAANLVLLDAIKSAGVPNWRQYMKDNEKPPAAQYQTRQVQSVPAMQGSGKVGPQESKDLDLIQQAIDRSRAK